MKNHDQLLKRLYFHLVTKERLSDSETRRISTLLYSEVVSALSSTPIEQPQDQQRAEAQEINGLAELAAREDIRG